MTPDVSSSWLNGGVAGGRRRRRSGPGRDARSAPACRSPDRRATPCRCARRCRRPRAARSGRVFGLTVMLSNMFTFSPSTVAAVDQQIDRAAEIRVRDVVERQPPQPRLADLRADVVAHLVELIGRHEVELVRVERIPRAVLRPRERRRRRAAQREAGAARDVRRARRVVRRSRPGCRSRSRTSACRSSGRPCPLRCRSAAWCRRRPRRALVMMPVPPSLLPMTTVLSCGIRAGERVLPRADAGQPRAVGAQVELAEHVALAGVRSGDDGAQLVAGGAALFAVHVDALAACRGRSPGCRTR